MGELQNQVIVTDRISQNNIKEMFLRRCLKIGSSQLLMHSKNVSQTYSLTLNSKSKSFMQQQRYLKRMPPLHHETDHEVLARPDTISVTFITKEGKSINVKGREGERLMYLAHRKGIDMEGACEASLACTTCHVYVESEDEHWDELPEATETEEDLLDMAPFLASNSRLGCQIILAPNIDGIVVRLPRATKNFYVDGHK